MPRRRRCATLDGIPWRRSVETGHEYGELARAMIGAEAAIHRDFETLIASPELTVAVCGGIDSVGATPGAARSPGAEARCDPLQAVRVATWDHASLRTY